MDRYSFDVGRSHPFPHAGLSRRFPHDLCESSRPGSRRLRAGHRLANQRAPARLLPGQLKTPGFDVTFPVTTRHQRPPSEGCAPSSWSPPDASNDAFSTSLTTTVFNQRSTRWFEASPRRAAPKGQPSSLAQHHFQEPRLHQRLPSAFVAHQVSRFRRRRHRPGRSCPCRAGGQA